MYCHFSRCRGYLAKTSQLWITGNHWIGWHHARKPYEPTVSKGTLLSRIGRSLIGSGKRRPLVTFLLWVNPDKINQKPRLSFSLCHSLALSRAAKNPIESFDWGFAAELNYPPTQSVAASKKPLLPATQFQQPPCRFPQYHRSKESSSRIRARVCFTNARLVLGNR